MGWPLVLPCPPHPWWSRWSGGGGCDSASHPSWKVPTPLPGPTVEGSSGGPAQQALKPSQVPGAQRRPHVCGDSAQGLASASTHQQRAWVAAHYMSPPTLAGQLHSWSIILIPPGCRFDPQAGHIQ